MGGISVFQGLQSSSLIDTIEAIQFVNKSLYAKIIDLIESIPK